jgi:hypothetical protein
VGPSGVIIKSEPTRAMAKRQVTQQCLHFLVLSPAFIT